MNRRPANRFFYSAHLVSLLHVAAVAMGQAIKIIPIQVTRTPRRPFPL